MNHRLWSCLVAPLYILQAEVLARLSHRTPEKPHLSSQTLCSSGFAQCTGVRMLLWQPWQLDHVLWEGQKSPYSAYNDHDHHCVLQRHRSRYLPSGWVHTNPVWTVGPSLCLHPVWMAPLGGRFPHTRKITAMWHSAELSDHPQPALPIALLGDQYSICKTLLLKALYHLLEYWLKPK